MTERSRGRMARRVAENTVMGNGHVINVSEETCRELVTRGNYALRNKTSEGIVTRTVLNRGRRNELSTVR